MKEDVRKLTIGNGYRVCRGDAEEQRLRLKRTQDGCDADNEMSCKISNWAGMRNFRLFFV